MNTNFNINFKGFKVNYILKDGKRDYTQGIEAWTTHPGEDKKTLEKLINTLEKDQVTFSYTENDEIKYTGTVDGDTLIYNPPEDVGGSCITLSKPDMDLSFSKSDSTFDFSSIDKSNYTLYNKLEALIVKLAGK